MFHMWFTAPTIIQYASHKYSETLKIQSLPYNGSTPDTSLILACRQKNPVWGWLTISNSTMTHLLNIMWGLGLLGFSIPGQLLHNVWEWMEGKLLHTDSFWLTTRHYFSSQFIKGHGFCLKGKVLSSLLSVSLMINLILASLYHNGWFKTTLEVCFEWGVLF